MINKDPRRIGLIATYSGGNLGDGAIQQAMLDNLIRRDPSAEVCGLTLCPADTKKRHGIPAFPITGLVLPYFSEFESLFSDGTRNQSVVSDAETPARKSSTEDLACAKPVRIGRLEGIIESLRNVKNVPVLGGLLRYGVERLRNVKGLAREVRQLWRSFLLTRRLDLIVVSGSGQLNEEWGGPWGLPYALFRWSLLARLTSTPFMVVSVGTSKVESPFVEIFCPKCVASCPISFVSRQ